MGYDTHLLLKDAGTHGPQQAEPVDVLAADASVGAATASDAAVPGPFDASPSDDPDLPVDDPTLPDPAEGADPSLPSDEQDGGAALGARDAGAARTDAGRPCGGARAFSLCWYLAGSSVSCNAMCSRHGGVDERAASLVGTSDQGGSVNRCARILSALGVTKPPVVAHRDDNAGLGCHLWAATGDTYWLENPPYSSAAVGPPEARVACGCKQ